MRRWRGAVERVRENNNNNNAWQSCVQLEVAVGAQKSGFLFSSLCAFDLRSATPPRELYVLCVHSTSIQLYPLNHVAVQLCCGVIYEKRSRGHVFRACRHFFIVLIGDQLAMSQRVVQDDISDGQRLCE